MLEVDFEEAFLDAVVSFYAVEHVPRERHAELLRRIHGWLRPGGLLLFTVEARETHDTVGDWLGEPMFFNQLEGGDEIEYLWVRARRPR